MFSGSGIKIAYCFPNCGRATEPAPTIVILSAVRVVQTTIEAPLARRKQLQKIFLQRDIRAVARAHVSQEF